MAGPMTPYDLLLFLDRLADRAVEEAERDEIRAARRVAGLLDAFTTCMVGALGVIPGVLPERHAADDEDEETTR
jgi:hypothetical protein